MRNTEFPPPSEDDPFDFGIDLTLPEAAFTPFKGKSFEDLLTERALKEERGRAASAHSGSSEAWPPRSDAGNEGARGEAEGGFGASFKASDSARWALEALSSLSPEEALNLARLAKQHPYALGWARDALEAPLPAAGSGLAPFSAAGFGNGYIDAGLGLGGVVSSLVGARSLGRIEQVARRVAGVEAPALAQGASRQAWVMASPAVAGAYLQPAQGSPEQKRRAAILDKKSSEKFAARSASLDALAPKVEAARKAARPAPRPGGEPERRAEPFDPIAAARLALDAAKAKASSVLSQALPRLRAGLAHAHSPLAAPVGDKRSLLLSASLSARRRIAASFAALGLPEPDLATIDYPEEPKEIGATAPRNDAADRSAAPAWPQETEQPAPDRAQAGAVPIDVKAALTAVERRDAMGLLKALPEGAPWPASARWSLAAYCAYHDWPSGLALTHRRGYPIDARGPDGLRPVDWALARKAWRAAAELWRLGALPVLNTPAKPSLLCAMIQAEAPLDALGAAIKAGADVNAPDALGSRPIHLAARLGSRAECEALVAAKADLLAKDGAGKLAREVAKNFKHYELSHYLQREGFRGRSLPGRP